MAEFDLDVIHGIGRLTERCHKAKRERDLARRDYECMNKFREHAEGQRDMLREALEMVLAVTYGGEAVHKQKTCPVYKAALAALKATEEG